MLIPTREGTTMDLVSKFPSSLNIATRGTKSPHVNFGEGAISQAYP